MERAGPPGRFRRVPATPVHYRDRRERPRWWVIALVALAHVAAIYGLARIFAPTAVSDVQRSVLASFNVSVPPPPPPPPPPPSPQPVPDEGAAGAPGRKAVPKAVTQPPVRRAIASPSPAPRVSSTGAANTSGASNAGAGSGAAGSGLGTGSGRGGGGPGGLAIATKPMKIAGDINSASDFPVPPGGRQARFGTSVTVALRVGIDGRASDCRIVGPSGDAEADQIVCRLAVQRFRFRPALDSAGNPVPASYGWRQRWFQQ